MGSRHRIGLSALLTILSPVLITGVLFSCGVLKDVKPDNFKTSVVRLDQWFLTNYQEAERPGSAHEPVHESAGDAAGETEKTPVVTCFYERPGEVVYGAKLIGVRKMFRLTPDDFFETKVYFENIGNVPWFSDDAACGEAFRLGTARETDRNSIFYSSSFVDEEFLPQNSGWLSGNRIKMKTLRVNPGEIGEFSFYSRAPHPDDVYLEYFAPVIEGVSWISDLEFLIPMHVGEFSEDAETLDLKLAYLDNSMRTSEADFSGGKIVEVDLSDQRIFVRIGNYVIKQFPASTGQPYEHPTPRGNYEVLYKQKVRIGGKPPYYIMPEWQAWRWDGYGLHALPSIGSAALRAEIRKYGPDDNVPVELYYGDALWTEALDHIGRPVSHGCIRLLPDDARFLYGFTNIGTPVVVHD